MIFQYIIIVISAKYMIIISITSMVGVQTYLSLSRVYLYSINSYYY